MTEDASQDVQVRPGRRPHFVTLIAVGCLVVGTSSLALKSPSTPEPPATSVASPEEPTPLPETPASSIVEPTPEEAPVPTLTQDQIDWLENFSWSTRTKGQRAIWVSVDEQMLRLIDGTKLVMEVRCATATNGSGSEMHSNKTPLGWHRVDEMIGSGAEKGTVFESRGKTGKIWTPGMDTKKDLVLTRILWLTGEEPGKNKGGTVDSRNRFIYIHGTNGEDKIGTPSSHGCVRMMNDDVIVLFDAVTTETPVLITERPS